MGRSGVLFAQVAWAVLSAAWNFGGVALIASGRRAPGPTASVAAGLLLLVMAGVFVFAPSRWPRIHALVSAIAAALAAFAVANAFTQDPALWPSETWRYAGIVLNGAGAIASLQALLGHLRGRA